VSWPNLCKKADKTETVYMCVCYVQEISSLDAREIAFIVLEQLPDVTSLDQDTFKVDLHYIRYEKW